MHIKLLGQRHQRLIATQSSQCHLALELRGMIASGYVIEYGITDDIDLNGWDVRKALRLFWKSNPTFVEWIQSPIKYIESGGFAAGARGLLPDVYSRERGIYHYRSMAKTTYRRHLCANRVPLKKYFYVLRPLLAVRWIERYGSAAPIEFEKLLHLLDGNGELLDNIQALLDQKRESPEMGVSEPVPSLNVFIEEELNRLESMRLERPTKSGVISKLNELLHGTLRELPDG